MRRINADMLDLTPRLRDKALSRSFLKHTKSKYRITQADYSAYRRHRWVHYSRFPEMKFNYTSQWNDPVAIYLFPEGFKTQGSWDTLRYKFTVEITPSAKVLDIAAYSKTPDKALELIRLLKAVPTGEEFAESDHKATLRDTMVREWRNTEQKIKSGVVPDFVQEHQQPHYFVDQAWSWLQRYFGSAWGQKPRRGAFAKSILAAGFDAVFDDTDSIFHGETQLLVVNPKIIKIVSTNDRRDTGYKDLEAAMQITRETLKRYDGKVVQDDRKPKLKPNRDGQILEGHIIFHHGERERSYESGGEQHRYSVPIRNITFRFETRRPAGGDAGKRMAHELNIWAEGDSETHREVWYDPKGFGRKYTDHHGVKVDEFDIKAVEPWVRTVMDNLWDDEKVRQNKRDFDAHFSKEAKQ